MYAKVSLLLYAYAMMWKRNISKKKKIALWKPVKIFSGTAAKVSHIPLLINSKSKLKRSPRNIKCNFEKSVSYYNSG